MASGQLSPFASCASGLGFLNYTTTDHRSTTSLLTPTASICTVSSLGQDDAAGRARTKTMQTKDILKSPLPHRFHLVPSGRRGRGPRTEEEGRAAKGRVMRKVGLGSPGLSGDSDVGGMGEEREEGDMFSPEASPLVPTQEMASPYSPQSPFINVGPVLHHDAPVPADHLQTDGALSPVLIQSRPTSTCSALSAQTMASITLVQDQGSKRYSSASGASYKEAGEKMVLLPESEPVLEQHGIKLDGPVETGIDVDVIPPEPAAEPLLQAIEPIDQEPDSEVGPTITQTKSTSLESLVSQYHALSNKLESPQRTHRKASASTSVLPSPSPKANRRATDGDLPSPTKPSSAGGKRRKFALRRQAIYAEYGFQIALPPDPDSDSAAVKVLRASPGPSPNKRAGGRGGHKHGSGGAGRAAAAYSALSSSGSVARLGGSSLSASASASSSLGSGLAALQVHSDSLAGSGSSSGGTYRDALFASLGSSGTLHGALAHVNDRLERLSVQEDILGARRNPFLEQDDLEEGVCTSTPSAKTRTLTARAKDAGKCFLVAYSGADHSEDLQSGALAAHLDDNFWTGTAQGGSSVSSLNDCQWTPLRITPQKLVSPVNLSLSLSVSRSERSARLSAWDVDPGHHPIVQELIDEVERAIEQWRWILQMRVYA
ncbi:hypothetical protein PYCCODRAFT_1468284 [Trametes coccinea BRFM310]|uniref:Uncharacterized protein n=1 Tax=Trametes coccinea (strain BRFM310) TaxID=1353009 RepID=A0A1Y2IKN2_TRAC3|nr:hypothetical protein PYCCODRAFT_1468284 [Trametes coccinea BRFM310]